MLKGKPPRGRATAHIAEKRWTGSALDQKTSHLEMVHNRKSLMEPTEAQLTTKVHRKSILALAMTRLDPG